MVRAPCCEKMGMKKGPWTTEEDQILISYIKNYGHGNWRALPKQAGLLRCGKSCRLRWTNYLRPDIKRGNFTTEEDETILKLHEMLGNRWSAIASRLPGRTDNEIKNVWHSHLKKKAKQNHANKLHSITLPKCDSDITTKLERVNSSSPMSPQHSFSDFSSVTESSSAVTITGDQPNTNTNNNIINNEQMDSTQFFPDFDDNLFPEALSPENYSMLSDFLASSDFQLQHQFPSSSVDTSEPVYSDSSNIDDGEDFWLNLFVNAGGYQNYQNSDNFF